MATAGSTAGSMAADAKLLAQALDPTPEDLAALVAQAMVADGGVGWLPEEIEFVSELLSGGGAEPWELAELEQLWAYHERQVAMREMVRRATS